MFWCVPKVIFASQGFTIHSTPLQIGFCKASFTQQLNQLWALLSVLVRSGWSIFRLLNSLRLPVAINLRPSSCVYNFQLLLENFKANCYHFSCEPYHSKVRGILIVKFVAIPSPGPHRWSNVFLKNNCMVIIFLWKSMKHFTEVVKFMAPGSWIRL